MNYWNFTIVATAAQRKAVIALAKLNKWTLALDTKKHHPCTLVFSCQGKRLSAAYGVGVHFAGCENIPFDLNVVNDILTGVKQPKKPINFKLGDYVVDSNPSDVLFVITINNNDNTFDGIIVKSFSGNIVGALLKRISVDCYSKCELHIHTKSFAR